jgi:exosortase B
VTATSFPRRGFDRLLASPWLLAGAGFLAMYLPTYWDLAGGLWQSDDQFHGPIVLAVTVWLLWTGRARFLASPQRPDGALGWPLIVLGLLLYVVGRSQFVLMFEVGSQVVVLAGLILLLHGRAGLRVLWFPLLYGLFMVPLPGQLVDALTGPLKQHVSVIAEHLLYWAGYPIARQGVILHVGQYQLLVADACSGLHSMFSLTALGLLFMHLMARPGRLHNLLMLLAILPVAFAANIVRVMILILVTYHLGDAAGQGFLHGTAGMVLLIAALLFLFLLDALFARLLPARAAESRS